MAMKYCDQHDIWYDYKEGCPECGKVGRIAGKVIGGLVGAAVVGTIVAGKAIGKAIKNNGNSNSEDEVSPVNLIDCQQTHNITCNKENGMTIHLHFIINNAYSQDVECCAYFCDKNERPLVDYNGDYNSRDGQVSVGTHVKPAFQQCEYRDLQLTIPYSELHLPRGKHQLKFFICIFINGNQVYSSDYYGFNYSSDIDHNILKKSATGGTPVISKNYTDESKISTGRKIAIALLIIFSIILAIEMIVVAIGV